VISQAIGNRTPMTQIPLPGMPVREKNHNVDSTPEKVYTGGGKAGVPARIGPGRSFSTNYQLMHDGLTECELCAKLWAEFIKQQAIARQKLKAKINHGHHPHSPD